MLKGQHFRENNATQLDQISNTKPQEKEDEKQLMPYL